MLVNLMVLFRNFKKRLLCSVSYKSYSWACRRNFQELVYISLFVFPLKIKTYYKKKYEYVFLKCIKMYVNIHFSKMYVIVIYKN